MKVELFGYTLPDERIAQRPLEERGSSRLLVLDRRSGARTHAKFSELASFLPRRALLVPNDSRVMPARLIGTRDPSGGRAEVLLLKRVGSDLDPFTTPEKTQLTARWGRWEALVSASKAIRPGAVIAFDGARATVVAEIPGEPSGSWHVDIDGDGDPVAGLARIGAPPLPPYIRRLPDGADYERYQTVYAKRSGSAAAPTAGLHFTPEHLEALRGAGHEIAPVTLHVGSGTFLPVRAEETSQHRMHFESYEIPEGTATAIRTARTEARAVIPIGTTALRTLEAAARDGGRVSPGAGVTNLFITPGFRFAIADHLLTNFHAPKSTLLMLVSAFAGLEAIQAAYAEALAMEYRFLSYGDAMLIL